MEWFNNLNAKPKIMFSFGIVLALLVAIGFLSAYELGKANARITVLYESDLKGLEQVDNVVIDRWAIAKTLRDMVVYPNDRDKVDASDKLVLAKLANMHTSMDSAEKLFYSVEGKKSVAAIRAALPGYEQAALDFLKLARARNAAGTKNMLPVLNTRGQAIADAVDPARGSKLTLANAKFEVNKQEYLSARPILLGTSVLALLADVMLSLILARGFSIPLHKAVTTLEQVAAGDLT